jgi:selenocysteine-specific elongation factor
LILGTAGHIDHGKTALVYALTGVWTDRLKEERERGISIDLGFAHWDAAPGLRVGIVDVPGHEDFIRNMVAGASGVDAALFVVSAEEGMMPQSREHLQILEQLGVERGVIAITKRDLVEPEWLELVSEAVAQEVGGTFLENAPRCSVSVRSGEGLAELRAALLDLARASFRRRADLSFRLPVDRCFTVRGVGTVVTGTPWSGTLSVEDPVRILPGSGSARVRSIQSHGAPATSTAPGRRTALALGGADRNAADRGSVVVTGEHWRAARLYQVRVAHGDAAARDLKSGSRVRVLLGTAEVVGRITLEAGASPLKPGTGAFGQLRLEGDLVANLGDRFVLRAFSPVETLGGGAVLWRSSGKLGPRRLAEASPLHRALLSPESAERLRAVLREKGVRGAAAGEAGFRAGLGEAEAVGLLAGLVRTGQAVEQGGRLYATEALEKVRAAIAAALAEFHGREKIRRGIPLSELRERSAAPGPLFERALADLAASGRVAVEHNQVRLVEHRSELGEREAAWRDALLARYEQAGLEPPDLDGALVALGIPAKPGRALLELLVEEGRLTKISAALYFHAAPLRNARSSVRDFLLERPFASVGELKDLLGVSRKYLIPLLEHFDREGLTRRSPAGRSLARS